MAFISSAIQIALGSKPTCAVRSRVYCQNKPKNKSQGYDVPSID